MEKTHFVYFIRAGKRGAIKIGHARNVERRMDQFQIGNAYKLYLIAKIPCESKGLAESIEKKFHSHFKRQKIRGEWFHGNIEFKRAIDKYNKDNFYREELDLVAEAKAWI